MGVVDQMSSIVHNSSGGQARTPYNSQHFLPLPTCSDNYEADTERLETFYVHTCIVRYTHPLLV